MSESKDAVTEGKDLPRGLEGLRKLAGDVLICSSLWGRLENSNEIDWGVTIDNPGSLRDTLSRLADEIESERLALTDVERRVLELWPHYEDGEPVQIGDDVIGPDYGERIDVDEVTFHANGFTLRSRTGLDKWYEIDDRFRRPAVLAADGVPLEVGQTVWHEDGTELMVLGFEHEEDCEQIVSVKYVDGPTEWCGVRSLNLTHTRPDSWERLEDDAREFARDNQLPHDADQMERDALDLVRRAKALAGVES